MRHLMRTSFILGAVICALYAHDASDVFNSPARAGTVSLLEDDTELNVPVPDTIRCRTHDSALELGTLFTKYSTSVQWSIPFSKYYELYLKAQCQKHLGSLVSKYALSRGVPLTSENGPDVLLVRESDADGVPTGSYMLIFSDEVLEMVFREDCVPPGSIVRKDHEEIKRRAEPCWIDF